VLPSCVAYRQRGTTYKLISDRRVNSKVTSNTPFGME
jgi:hypothetical protein